MNTPDERALRFTTNISSTLITNLSITFFFFLFFIINKTNFYDLKKDLFKLKFKEFFILILFFITLIFYL